MSKSLRALVMCLFVLACTTVAYGQASSSPRRAWPAYGLSIFVGFGTGLYYLGENGTPFLLGDLSGVALVGGGYAYLASHLLGSMTYPYRIDPSAVVVGYAIIGLGGVVYLVSRIWEVVDVFGVADRLRNEGRVVGVHPRVHVDPTKVSLELSAAY